ncbi:DNA topoisomerase 3-alpha-like isoform X1 [Octopus vulgaris]|uniref:DNA topoisomerase n=2 Tax=Octopus vulgaris TaxID=6645 RepID=A0AA36BUQ3_OCTVU|nr:DNA topoisomerase 3-alpha-like isoform X1 [Octopus vulgaris]
MVNLSASLRNAVSTMTRILNVAEKNDAAKSLAEVLSRGNFRRREGRSVYNKIYEFEYHLFNKNCIMSMTSVSGHLLGMEFTGLYKKWTMCNPVSLFEATIQKYCPPDFLNIKKTLEEEIRKSQVLIIWTDCDREGENIGFEIIQVCQAVKPNINIYRARFSEITPQAVNRACQNLAAPDENVSMAVDARMELDLRIGAAFTRFQTLRLQKVFPEVLAEHLISYGSCQFPTLGFVVERYKQVEAFIAEPFWKLKVTHKVDDVVAEFTWQRKHLFDYLVCLVFYEHCLESPTAVVCDVKSRQKSKWRPQPLDTVELEKLASRKLKVGAKETMKIAEKLYTQGIISYPRTETNMFTKEIDLNALIGKQTEDPAWGAFASRVLEDGPNPRNGNKSDQAHPPIHPTKYCNSLQGNEKKIYEFIVRHFLATCSQDAKGHETTVEIEIAQEKFTANGLMILAKNYLEVYPYDKWSDKEISIYQVGQSFEPTSLEMLSGKTSPPSLLSEADLISLMEKHGIGTDATHAEHIETIKSRNYVGVRDDGRFVPGHLGMGLVEGYDAMGFAMSKPNLRAELEADLKKVCEGQKTKEDVLQAQIRNYKEVFIKAVEQARKIDEALGNYLGESVPYTESTVSDNMATVESVKRCPKCNQDMLLRQRKDGKGYYLGCIGFPECRNAMWFPDFVLKVEVDGTICPRCQPGPVHLLRFKFRPGYVPPMIPTEYVGCIGGCDTFLMEALDIHSSQNRQTSSSLNNRTPSTHGDSGYGSEGSNNSLGNNRNSFQSQRTNRNITSGSWQSKRGEPQMKKPGMLNVQSRPRTALNNRNGDRSDATTIVCGCNVDAILLTVRKEGPNTGRQFYKCNSNTCDFFLWADQNSSSTTSSSSFPSNPGSSRPQFRSSHSNASEQTVSCQCNLEAKHLTVQKEGPNKGRKFFACPQSRDVGCNFFQWDDNSTSSGSGNSYSSQRFGNYDNQRHQAKKQKTNQSGVNKRASPKCGICGTIGHTKRTCPHKMDF